jgi:hypothetical protein
MVACFLSLLCGLVLGLAGGAAYAFTGPVATITDLATTITDGNVSNGNISNDAKMAVGSGKTISISYAPGSTIAKVYWGVTTAQLSLDDESFGTGETLAPNNKTATVATWTGSTYIYDVVNGAYTAYYASTELVLTFSKLSGAGAVNLVNGNDVGLGSGYFLLLDPNTTYNVKIEFLANLGGAWTAAYDLAFAYHGRQLGMAYTFAHGFHYDRAPTSITLSNNKIDENKPGGSYIGSLTASDLDSASVAFSLSGTDVGSFSLSGANLSAGANRSFDYEVQPAKTQYSITATATDSAGNTLSQPLTIVIGDVEEPPFVKSALTNRTVLEDFSGLTNGAVSIDLIPVFGDHDSKDQTLNYSVSVSPSGAVNASMDPSQYNMLRLTSVHDSNGPVSIRVTATDKATTAYPATMSVTTNFTLTITPVNDAPTISYHLSNSTNTVSLNEDFGTHTKNIASAFADVDGPFPLTYSVTRISTSSALTNTTSNLQASVSGSTLTLTSVANQNGTFYVGIAAYDGTFYSPTNILTVQVQAVNDQPSFTLSTTNFTVLENSGFKQQAAFLTRLNPGGGPDEQTQTNQFTFIVTRNTNTNLTSSLTIGSGGALNVTPARNMSGSATITVQLNDNGGTNYGGVQLSTLANFTLTVVPVNQPPTIATIPKFFANENPSATGVFFTNRVSLTGISAGANETNQNLTITARVVSTNSPLILTNLLVTYVNPSSTGLLAFSSLPYLSGTNRVQITVTDSGSTTNGGVNVTNVQFDVVINPVDHPPFGVAGVPPAQSTLEDTPLTVSLNGAFQDRDGDSFGSSLTIFSSNPSILTAPSAIANPARDSNGLIANLVLTPRANAYTRVGTGSNNPVVITMVAVANGKSATNTFQVTVTEVNDPPTVAPIQSQFINEDVSVATVALTGLSPGPNEAGIDSITTNSFRFSSSDTNVIPASSIFVSNLNTNAGTALLSYFPVPLKTGSVALTMILSDARGASTTNSFSVQLNHINHAPALNTVLPPAFRTNMVFTATNFVSSVTNNVTNILANVVRVTNSTLVFLEDQVPANIGLTNLFVDIDGDVVFHSIFANTNSSLVQAVLADAAGSNLDLTFTPDGFGKSDVTIRGSDTYLDGYFTFSIVVVPVNDPPSANVVSPQEVNEDTGIHSFSVNAIVPGPASELGQSVTNVFAQIVSTNSPAPISSVSVAFTNGQPAAVVSYSTVTNANGQATIRIFLQDNGGTNLSGINISYQDVLVTVDPVSDEPILVKPYGVLTVQEDQFRIQNNQTNVDLSTVYQEQNHVGVPVDLVIDPNGISDPQDILDDKTFGRVGVDPNHRQTLILSFIPDGYGTATIKYRGISDGILASSGDTVTVTVQPVNDPPILSPVPAQVVNEDSGPYAINLSFTPGPANESNQKIKTVSAQFISSLNSNLLQNVSVSFTPGQTNAILRYTLGLDQIGQGIIRLTIQDDGGTGLDGLDTLVTDIPITIQEVDDPPKLARAVTQLSFFEDQFANTTNTTSIDLSGAFTDPENVYILLSLGPILDPNSVLDDETGGVAVDAGHGQRLSVRFVPNVYGPAEIQLAASANGVPSPDTHSVKIQIIPVNDPPSFDALTNQNITLGAAPGPVSITSLNVGPSEDRDQHIQSVTAVATQQNPTNLISSLNVAFQTNSPTAILTYSVTPNRLGTATVRVTVLDDGGVANGGFNSSHQDFLITVTGSDTPPQLVQPAGSLTFREEDIAVQPLRSANLHSVFSDGGAAPITLIINQVNDPANIIQATNLVFDPQDPGRLLISFNTNSFGTASISYRAVANRRLSTNSDTLTLIVLPFDDAPTIDPIFRQIVSINSGTNALTITGISPGANEGQSVTLSAQIRSQDTTNLVSSFSLKHVGTNSTATFQYVLGQNQSGTASVRITATDSAGNSSFRDFRILVVPANGPPLLSKGPASFVFLEDQFIGANGQTTLDLTGVYTDLDSDPISLVLGNITDASNILADEQGLVQLNSTNKQGIDITFRPHRFGTASIVLGAVAGGLQSASNTFATITLLPVNDPPTLNPIPNQTIAEDGGTNSITLTGISPGPTNEIQNIKSITASFTNGTPGLLLANPSIQYSSNAPTAVLRYQVAQNVAGSGVIRVTVQDDGGVANGGIDSTSQDFILTVTPVDDPPQLVPGQELLSRSFTATDLAGSNNVALIDLSTAFSDAEKDPMVLVPGPISDPDNILADQIPGAIAPTATSGMVLAVTFLPSAYGRAQIPLRALARGLFSVNAATLTVIVTPANGAPSIDVVPDVEIPGNSGLQAVAFSGVRVGSPASGASNIVSLRGQVLSQSTNGLITSLLVNYRTNDPSGSVQFVPGPGVLGQAVIRLTVTDDGSTNNGRVNFFNRDFNVSVVKPANPPVLATNSIPDQVFLEDAFASSGRQTFINLQGVFKDPDNDRVILRIVQVSDPQNVLDDESGNVAVDPFNTERLRVVFRPNAFGQARLTLGASAAGVNASATVGLNIVVNPVNDPPTLDPILALTVTQNRTPIIIPLTGITYGPTNENQIILAVTASVDPQSPTNIVQTLQATYSTNATNLQITLNPAIIAGSALINVTAKDNGGTANGGADTINRAFTLNVNISPNPPVLVQPKGAVTYLEDAFSAQGNKTAVDLTGVFAQSDGKPIALVLGAIDDPQNVLNDEAAGQIQFATNSPFVLNLSFVPNSFGTARVSYRALSQGTFSTNFDTLTINITPVNDAPSFNSIASQNVIQGAGAQTVSLTGLNVGPFESSTQVISNISVTVISQTPADLVTNPVTVVYTNGSTARITYAVNPARFGTATLQITVKDSGGTANGGQDSAVQTFSLTVTKVDHPPVISGSLPAGAQPQFFLEDQFAANSTLLDLTGLFTDPDGDLITYNIGPISDPNDFLDNESGGVRFDSSNSQRLQLLFRPNGFGIASIPVFGVANGRFSPTNLISITVTNVNDPPTFNAVPSQTTVENSATNRISVLGIGVGPGERNIQAIASGTVGVITQTTNLFAGTPVFMAGSTPSTGQILYVLNPGRNGSAILRLTLQDNGGTSNGGQDTFTRNIAVNVSPALPVDRPPVLNVPFGQTNLLLGSVLQLPQSQLTLNLSSSFIDPDGDAVTLFLVSISDTNNIVNNETAGQVQFTAPQTLLVTLNTNVTGSAQITYLAIAKGQLSTNTDTVTINIAANAAAFPASVRSLSSSIASQSRLLLLGPPISGETLRAIWNGDSALPAGTELQWETAQNDLGLHTRIAGQNSFGIFPVPPSLDGLFLRARLVNSEGSPNQAGGAAIAESDFVSIGEPVADFVSWRSRFIFSRDANARGEESDDPDADNIPNLVEYALGLDPLKADLAPAPFAPVFLRDSQAALALDFVQLPLRKDVASSIEVSSDLVHWTPVVMQTEVLRQTTNARLLRLKLPISNSSQFLRLRFRKQ